MIIKQEKEITISFPDGQKIVSTTGVSLYDLAQGYEDTANKKVIVAAKVNNVIFDLNTVLFDDADVEFIDLSSEDGVRIYRRSLYFIMSMAVRKLFPNCVVKVEHSVSSGVYCEVRGIGNLSAEDVTNIEKQMRDIINRNVPFISKSVSLKEAIKILLKDKQYDAVRVLKDRPIDPVTIYKLGNLHDLFNGFLVPSAGFLKLFKLISYLNGFLLMSPEKTDPSQLPEFKDQRSLATKYSDCKSFVRDIEIEDVIALNKKIDAGPIAEVIAIAEANQEKHVAIIAEQVAKHQGIRVITIAGPSSSGKTTFAQRLSIQLRLNGIRPVTISLDDYFVNREDTPKDENGEYDFESIEAIDLTLFNEHLKALINGAEVEVPKYNFLTGMREPEGSQLNLEPNQVLIIEGIHGLNEMLTKAIDRKYKFKIYISALTLINIDNHNRIRTTDIRLIRRIVRDNQFRGNDAVRTINLWPSVRRGEEKNIFPYQEEADAMFNSGLVYELAALKPFAEPLLNDITQDMDEYSEAERLLKILSFFKPVDSEIVPSNSLLREFIGGYYYYHHKN